MIGENMRVFNKEKTYELYSYDLERGYLSDDKLFLKHHPAISGSTGKFHYVVSKTYANGGKEMKKVWDIEPIKAQEAYDEYEDIKVYIPYTEKELAEIEIKQLKDKLHETDYQAIKYAEGELSFEQYQSMKNQRKQWIERINYLEKI